MLSRRSLAVLGWLAVVLVATLAGIGAVRLVGDSLTGTPGGVRSQADVARDLAAASSRPTTRPTTAAPTATGTPTASPHQDGQMRTFSISGGLVTARCTGDQASIVTWRPADGYTLRDSDVGPDDEAEVKFESTGGDHSEIKIRCQGGQPVRVGHDD
ncbi:septum formation initiator [Asanoa sp. NPDC050611]|uniref:septum formation initiator n=1 Tax=Asanoa sp. NPDC050611 TaxID=3157098 RepID=UPI0033C7A332